MKHKRAIRPAFFLTVCALFSVALLVSVLFLVDAKADVKELEADVVALAEENQQLTLLNQALQTQLNSYVVGTPDSDLYCVLNVDDWSQKNGNLTVDAFAQAFLPAGTVPTARIELWRGSDVIATEPVTLSAVDGAFEAEASLSFKIPAIEAEEELELWLIVESDSFNTLFTCGAGWYAENGQLMIIAG